jgi:hypothetical protein
LRVKGYPDANVSGAGFNWVGKKSRYSLAGNGVLSRHFDKASSASDGDSRIPGYKYNLGFQKISGRFLFTLTHTVLNNTFDTRDLGYLVLNNYISDRLDLKYNQYHTSPLLRNMYNTFSINRTSNFTTHERTDLTISGSTSATLLSYITLNLSGGVSPLSNKDYYEPRTAGWYYRTSQYYYMSTGISSDYRKKLAIDASFSPNNFFTNNYAHLPALPGFDGYLSPRYRFSDKFSMSCSVDYNIDPYNVGYADKDSNSNIIFGGRKLHTLTNTLSGRYIFKNNMSLGLNVRHYWSTGNYLKYYYLQPDGDIIPTDQYAGNQNFNYNVFNVDLVYTWVFLPGSTLSVDYKNAIEKQEIIIPRQYISDLDYTFRQPQLNVLSVKVLYYLDYLYLKGKNV